MKNIRREFSVFSNETGRDRHLVFSLVDSPESIDELKTLLTDEEILRVIRHVLSSQLGNLTHHRRKEVATADASSLLKHFASHPWGNE